MNLRTLLAVLAVVCLSLLGCSRSPPLKELSVDEVAARIAAQDGKTFLYDANSKERYAEGHLPGAKWIQYDNLQGTDLPADRASTLVFYCASSL